MTEAWKQWEGQVVNGELRLHQYLGSSDHSAVFLTEYGERDRQKAAIKLISADPASAPGQLSQWKLAAQLAHPHLIRLFSMGRCRLGDKDFLFAVTQYAPEDLSQVLPQRSLTPAEAQDLLDPALDALAYLHSQGFVHGHLKPANILAVDDQLKLSVDRLCRIVESAADLEKPGAHDPPEKASGAISPAGDVWSLGMILAEALTQRLPVWESTGQGDPVLPETLPAPFSDVVRNCLRRDPKTRWTVAEIKARLHQTVAPTPELPTVGTRPRSAKWRFLVPALAVAVVAVVLGGSRLLQPRREAEPSSAPAMEQPRPQIQAPETPATERATQKADDQPQPPAGSSNPPPSAVETKTGTDRPEGGVVHQVLPDVSPGARATITGKVKVKVRVEVDAAGNVAGAKLLSPGPSKYFARVALQAAQRWKFVPVNVAGQNLRREWVLRFEFGRTGTRVIPAQVAPSQ